MVDLPKLSHCVVFFDCLRQADDPTPLMESKMTEEAPEMNDDDDCGDDDDDDDLFHYWFIYYLIMLCNCFFKLVLMLSYSLFIQYWWFNSCWWSVSLNHYFGH